MVGRPFGVEQRLFEFYEIPVEGIPWLGFLFITKTTPPSNK
jgi:hypothetical protein